MKYFSKIWEELVSTFQVVNTTIIFFYSKKKLQQATALVFFLLKICRYEQQKIRFFKPYSTENIVLQNSENIQVEPDKLGKQRIL